jgi:serine/threonine-protein kinase HipA
MTVNGKRDAFTMADVRSVAKGAGLKRGRAEAIHEEVRSAVLRWPELAGKAKLAGEIAKRVAKAHRLELRG